MSNRVRFVLVLPNGNKFRGYQMVKWLRGTFREDLIAGYLKKRQGEPRWKAYAKLITEVVKPDYGAGTKFLVFREPRCVKARRSPSLALLGVKVQGRVVRRTAQVEGRPRALRNAFAEAVGNIRLNNRAGANDPLGALRPAGGFVYVNAAFGNPQPGELQAGRIMVEREAEFRELDNFLPPLRDEEVG